jgi:hypothetical protein
MNSDYNASHQALAELAPTNRSFVYRPRKSEDIGEMLSISRSGCEYADSYVSVEMDRLNSDVFASSGLIHDENHAR